MKHVGDITKLNGAELPVVDCIFGGSPCQDLSVAGKRAGMKHSDKGDEETTRSGLFMDQVRLVKEMREHDRGTGRSGRFVRPRYMVWENVPGALSSPGGAHKGEDFAAVLEEIVRIVCEEVPAISVPKEGWPNAGCISGVGDSGCAFSVCWRVHDAQFWGATQFIDGRMRFLGTPQRRRRIALVADFGGLSAPEVLFERKGLSWDSDEGGEEGKRTPARTERSTTFAIEGNGARPSHLGTGVSDSGVSYTLNTIEQHGVRDIPASAGFSFGQSAKAYSIGYEEELSPTIRGGEGGNQKPCVLDNREPMAIENHPSDGRCRVSDDGIVQTLRSRMGTGGNNTPLVMEQSHSISFQERAGKPGGGKGILIQDEHTGALSTLNIQHVFSIQGNTIDRNAKQNGMGISEDVAHTLDSVDRHGVAVTEPIAFAQNQRDEVRDLNNVATSLAAESGMHQQTFAVTEGRNE